MQDHPVLDKHYEKKRASNKRPLAITLYCVVAVALGTYGMLGYVQVVLLAEFGSVMTLQFFSSYVLNYIFLMLFCVGLWKMRKWCIYPLLVKICISLYSISSVLLYKDMDIFDTVASPFIISIAFFGMLPVLAVALSWRRLR
jgi:hypothetical protein